jgi:hypothetical protein
MSYGLHEIAGSDALGYIHSTVRRYGQDEQKLEPVGNIQMITPDNAACLT